MRLTGGADRGRKLRAPRGAATRPTASRVREAIFNILGHPPATAILDLFAGTGALGIEALSRGAPKAVFVEREGRALAALGRNLREIGVADRAVVLSSSVHAAIGRLAHGEERFGWVFVDPPYATSDADRTLEALAGSDLLASGAVVVIEHDKRRALPESVGVLRLSDRRAYGDTAVSFYRRAASLA
jgi:16S rRNA (guanine(966)-N(2))-methyltransferase RsmD